MSEILDDGQFAKDFAHRRFALGFTQEQMAFAVGVDRQTIIKWEQGKRVFSEFFKLAIMEALHNEKILKFLDDQKHDLDWLKRSAIREEERRMNPTEEELIKLGEKIKEK